MTVKQALDKSKNDILGQFKTKSAQQKSSSVSDRKKKWYFWPVVIALVIFILIQLAKIF